MIETITHLLLYALVFTFGFAFGTFNATKEYFKRNEKLLTLLNKSTEIIQNQMTIIEDMKKVRPVFKTVKEGQNETTDSNA